MNSYSNALDSGDRLSFKHVVKGFFLDVLLGVKVVAKIAFFALLVTIPALGIAKLGMMGYGWAVIIISMLPVLALIGSMNRAFK